MIECVITHRILNGKSKMENGKLMGLSAELKNHPPSSTVPPPDFRRGKKYRRNNMFSDLTEKMAEDIKTFDKITMIFNQVLPKIYELERTGKLPAHKLYTYRIYLENQLKKIEKIQKEVEKY